MNTKIFKFSHTCLILTFSHEHEVKIFLCDVLPSSILANIQIVMTKYCMNTKCSHEAGRKHLSLMCACVKLYHRCVICFEGVTPTLLEHCYLDRRIAFKGDWSHNVSIITASNVVIDFISCHFVLLEAWEQTKWYTFLLFVMLETIVTNFRV